MQTQSDGVVDQEVTRADGQEHIGVAVDGIQPVVVTRDVLGSKAGGTGGVGEQHVHAVHGLTGGSLYELGEHGLHQDLLLRSTEGHDHVVVDVEAQGVETEEQGDPAQVADDRFLVLEHPSQDVVLVGFGVVVTDEEDRTVGEGTAHQGDGDVLVVGVQGCLGRVVLRDEGVRRHRVHVLRHQAGDHAEGGEGQAELEVQAVVDGVVETFVTGTEVTRGALGGVVGLEDLLDGVTDPEVGPVHVAGDHEDATDGQVVVGDVGEPQSFALRMETAKEGEDRSACTVGAAEGLVQGIRVLGIHTPVAGEEGSKTGGVGQNVEEVVPTNVLTAGFGDRNVNQVTGPGDGAEAEQNGEVMVQA